MGYAKLKELREQMRKPESIEHDLSGKRFEAVRAFDAAMADLRSNLPVGVMQASPRALRSELSRFVLARTHQRGESIHRGTTSATEVGMRREGGKTIAFDAGTGEPLGEMNDIAVTPRSSWSHELTFYGSPEKDAAFLGLAYGSPEPSGLSPTLHALPLAGPLAEHPAFARMAKAARRILDNQFDALQVIRRVDKDAARNHAEREALAAKARALMDEAVAQSDPRSSNPELTRLIEGMDWTFDYADRPRSEHYAQRDAIRRGLHAMDPDEAIAYVGVAKPWGWTYALSILGEHPKIRRAA